MTEVIANITSSRGDEYRLRLSSSGSRFLSDEIRLKVSSSIDILTIELERIKGQMPTGHAVLAQIEKIVADTFMQHSDSIICFICDFMSPIPSTRKKIPVQQYRSLLFTKMFERYLSLNAIEDVMQSILTIEGINEEYYIHIIARNKHVKYVNMLGEDIRTGYSK